jgi:hypothetical protein
MNRRYWSAGLAAVAFAGGLVATATPSNAATVTIPVDCSVSSGPTLVTASPGDTLVFTSGNCNDGAGTSFPPAVAGLFDSVGDSGPSTSGPFTWVVSPTAALGTYGGPTDGMIGISSAVPHTAQFYLRLVAPAASAPIPAWVQAYGRASAAAPCIQSWNQSWQAWAEPVTGGWVCTRTIPSIG